MDIDAPFFADRPVARRLFDALHRRMAALGPVELAATKSRVSFVVRTRFCWCHEATLTGIWIGFNLARPVEGFRGGPIGNKWSYHAKLQNEAEIDALMPLLAEAYAVDAA